MKLSVRSTEVGGRSDVPISARRIGGYQSVEMLVMLEGPCKATVWLAGPALSQTFGHEALQPRERLGGEAYRERERGT